MERQGQAEPDRLYIAEGDRETKYKKLLAKGSPLERQDTKDLFILAMLKGIELKKDPILGPNKDGYVRTSYLVPRDRALIYAAAVHRTGSLEVLTDKKQTFEIAERYACGGVQALVSDVFNENDATSYERRLELQARELLSRLKLGGGPKQPPLMLSTKTE
jgi:hypothetical protein